ncbi:MAG TPA: ankyrin repeat domain-containing protein [Pirellulaceae bacterium]|nr:ankyrin repeat domain-containing protein [Pirellulaceae bacterium]
MGRTGLMWAAWLQKWRMVKYLIEAGASKISIGLTVRMLEATLAEMEKQQRSSKGRGRQVSLSGEIGSQSDEKKKLDGFPKLLAYLKPLVDASVALPHDPPTLGELYQFEMAIRKNARAKIESMLAKWPDIDQRQQEIGFTMHTAAHSGQAELVKFFLDRGHEVGVLNWVKNTPLHFAAQYNKPEVVALLLEHGANPLAEDLDGDTPLGLANGKVKAMLQTAAKAKT